MSATPNPKGQWVMALALIGILGIAMAPLPPILFDLLIGLSICLAALTFLVAFYVEKPTEFSSFPSLLLFVTLFRLALNVASTRLILTGTDSHAAGAVIAAFGEFVIGGNFVVGAVVFLILVIVNFIVITKGAERISEVSARFTLDSMPGKQMAIDADLGAGLINEKDARERRKAIQREADFHGAMDGASKFVRGDAIAGILVLAVNVVGGILIGVAQKDMSIGHAAQTYTVLSIGDGLVAQIPALLVSTGAALLTTRGEDAELGRTLGGQLLSRRRPLVVTGVTLIVIGLLPGMPHILFLALGGTILWAARRAKDGAAAKPGSAEAAAKTGAPAPVSDERTQRGEDAELGRTLGGQLLSRRRPLVVTGVTLIVIGLLPGMPHILFLALGGTILWAARRAKDGAAAKPGSAEAAAKTGAPAPVSDERTQRGELEAQLPVELLTLEVGLDLLGLVDASRGGELLTRIAALRKQLALELGVIIPPVHIRDDLRLRPGGYRVLLSGVSIAESEVHVHKVLAIDPTGSMLKHLPGETTTEPTFGLPAKWLSTGDRTRAEATGCTVVDAAAVIATHLTELLRRHAHELLGRREAQELLDIAGKHNGKVIEELIPHLLPMGSVMKVLKNLLSEGVSVRDIRTILEALADHAQSVKSPDDLTEMVRQRLARRITRAQLSGDGSLRPLVLDPRAELLLRDGTGRTARALTRLTEDLANRARDLAMRDEPTVLVVAPDLRRTVAGIASRHVPGLAVLSYREVDPTVPFVTRGVVSAQEAA